MNDLVALIDSDTLIDVLTLREPFADTAKKVFQACLDKKVAGYIAAHSITNIFYILRKNYSLEERKQMLLDLFDIVDVVGVVKSLLIKALVYEDFDDIEDRLQVECAQAVNADYIITRNIGDFTTSPIPAILPKDF
ncbi:MAG: PIN domain-containing protein, partial [Treponema sp.]|nr:PIN domain-containing protein [Treponema sp.]